MSAFLCSVETRVTTTTHVSDGLYLTLLAAGGKVPSEESCLPIEKCVSYLLPNLLEIISLTLRDHGVRVNCPAKMGKMGDMYWFFILLG